VTRLKGLALPLAIVALWQLGAMIFGVHSDTLSKPSDILVSLFSGLTDSSLLAATGSTLASAGGGLLLGAVMGVACGLLFGLIPTVSRLMRVTVEVLRPIPAVAIAPIVLLVFGFGYRLEIAIVGFACFFPMMILTEAAIRQIAPRLMEVARVLRLSAGQQVAKVVVPASLPRIFVALRLAAGLALIVAVTVEIAVNPMGLGYRLMLAAQSLRPADMFATLIWIGLIGWGLNYALVRVGALLFAPGSAPRVAS
jgi:ABC-type nitrate/sulfonate/bicarbonate transport system permease component